MVMGYVIELGMCERLIRIVDKIIMQGYSSCRVIRKLSSVRGFFFL